MVRGELNQQGQTLLIVIFAMSLGLLVMVNTAGRVVASVARTAQTNNYQKAVAIAEGGAETFLVKSFSDYPDLADSSECPTSKLSDLGSVKSPDCVFSSPSSEAKAYLGVEEYPTSSERDLRFRSRPGETVHVNLQGLNAGAHTVRVCWKGLGRAGYSASYYFYYYGTPGSYSVDKNMYTCDPASGYANCALPGGDIQHVDPATSTGGYWCYSTYAHSYSVALRLFTFPDGADYMLSVFNSSGGELPFPPQGYRIVSIGETTGGGGSSLDSKKATRKKVTVEKTFPYPAGPWWDFALTSVEGSVRTTP